jgi:cellulose synthase/poly-beta-1,6-N-acetylglucosamine synthase-like glycosyltransferase/glycosyltransferase involved in cell wall biosynthesis
MEKSNRAQPKISVVIPIFNERQNLPTLIKRLEKSLSAFSYELLFVDDHSTDGSYQYLRSLRNHHIVVLKKQGKKGKAFSLLEGFAKARGSILAMIDGDLQYPPEAIPSMIATLSHADVVVAQRKANHVPLLRRIMSTCFRFTFGKLLFNLPYDIQSGLKVFKKKVITSIPLDISSPWSFDLAFLSRAKHEGFRIKTVAITFTPRSKGDSKISPLRSSFELAFQAIALKFTSRRPIPIPPPSSHTMRGAGIHYKKRTYITHSTLSPSLSALQTFYTKQKLFLLIVGLLFGALIVLKPLAALQTVTAVLSIIYFLDVVFNLFLVLKSINTPQELHISQSSLSALSLIDLPVYTVLCPLYREVHVLPQFLQAIAALEWPKDKLDVLLLLEEDDKETIEAVKDMMLPSYVRPLIVPNSLPKTKPKACNYGLSYAKGEFLVIYDAEDIPDPLQLKKAYVGFQESDRNVVCLQAKLNYYNQQQNLLTRLFTAEYSLWFDITLPGLQSLGTSIPLGGTSNHFRVSDLVKLQGWDPFNVTEDADLGVRLFNAGYKTAIIDSTTLEEANSAFHNWLRQRSRWIKGYLQTYVVHMRHQSVSQLKDIHSFMFQLTVGGKLAFIFINPLLWIMTLSYFFLHALTGSFIASLYPSAVFYMAIISLVFGNFLFLYYYMIGCAKREEWGLIKYVFLVPFYWVMISIAGSIAFYQFLVKPHYWEKTVHGLHLKKPVQEPQRKPEPTTIPQPVPVPARLPWLPKISFGLPDLSFATAAVQSVSKVRMSTPSFEQLFGLFLLPSFSLGMYVIGDTLFSRIYFLSSEVVTYMLASVVGKIIILTGYLIIAFQYQDKRVHLGQKEEKKQFDHFLLVSFLPTLVLFGIFTLFPEQSLTLLFGDQGSNLLPYIFPIAFGAMCYILSFTFVFFYSRRHVYSFSLATGVIALLQVVLFTTMHQSLSSYVFSMQIVGGLNLIVAIVLYINLSPVRYFEKTLSTAGFGPSGQDQTSSLSPRILIFNWRDTRHTWSGGAEVYIQEMAKRWAKSGSVVTMFCGNDGKSSARQKVDGIQIIRRGGMFTVYFWAMVYYLFSFRGKYDVIVDCENGIPFFTPLYTRKPVLLVVHHVHQEVFRKHLIFPLAQFAAFLEAKLMPLVYRQKTIITVSESSRVQLLKLGLGKTKPIDIIFNGINAELYQKQEKTPHPTFVYLGRLKHYKRIDIAIKAFGLVHKLNPTAELLIVGDGESMPQLRKVTADLKLEESVHFLRHVSDEKKAEVLGKSWVMLQPSMVEGWGLTVIEANACGTPVIAAKVNGLKDSVQHRRTGLLVDPNAIMKFAQAMDLLTSDEALRLSLSEQAYAWSRSFNWDQSAQLFYAHLIDEAEQPSRPIVGGPQLVFAANNEYEKE